MVINYIILSITLMFIGIYGLLTKTSLLKILISIELLATAASMNFVLLTTSASKVLGEVFLVLTFSTDTCITGIILALLIVVSKRFGISDVRNLVSSGTDELIKDQEENVDKNAGN